MTDRDIPPEPTGDHDFTFHMDVTVKLRLRRIVKREHIAEATEDLETAVEGALLAAGASFGTVTDVYAVTTSE